MKKQIKCPDCNVACIEINKAMVENKIVKMYPKDYEYRYYCSRCKKEWLHNTQENIIEGPIEDPQFTYDESKGYLVLNTKFK